MEHVGSRDFRREGNPAGLEELWRTNSLTFSGGSWIIIHTKYSRVLYDTILHSANLFETKLGQEGPKTTFCPTLANDNEKVLRKQQRRLGRVRYRVTRQVDD